MANLINQGISREQRINKLAWVFRPRTINLKKGDVLQFKLTILKAYFTTTRVFPHIPIDAWKTLLDPLLRLFGSRLFPQVMIERRN